MKNNYFALSLIFVVLGMAIVILGALFKIMHYSLGSITGNHILIIGMLVEAVAMGACMYILVQKAKDKK